MKRKDSIGSLIGLVCSSYLVALTTPLRAEPDIVVEGSRLTKPIVQRTVKAISPYFDGSEPMPRFQTAICIAVAGMPKAYEEQIANSILDVANSVGISDNPDARCRPNIYIIFADEPVDEVEHLLAVKSPLVSSLSRDEEQGLRGQSGAAISWSVAETRTKDGMPLQTAVRPPPGQSTPGLNIPSGVKVAVVNDTSRVNLPVRSDLSIAVVMIDKHEASKFSAKQIGNYAALSALTAARLDEHEKGRLASSILSLFTVPKPPEGLTSFDQAYIRGRYIGRSNISPDDEAGRVLASIRAPQR